MCLPILVQADYRMPADPRIHIASRVAADFSVSRSGRFALLETPFSSGSAFVLGHFLASSKNGEAIILKSRSE